MQRLRSIAAALTILAACHSSPGTGDQDAPLAPDAPAVADASPDGSPDALPTGTVTVTLYDSFAPEVPADGWPVVFSRPDGTFVTLAFTGKDGKATGPVTAGDSVTAIGKYDMWTILDVQPGDDLTIRGGEPIETKLGVFHLTAPAYAGAKQYRAASPCALAVGSATPEVTLDVLPSCGATADVAMIACDDAGAPLGYLMATGVAYTSGATLALAGTWKPMPAFTAHYKDIVPQPGMFITASRLTELDGGWAMGTQAVMSTLDLQPPTTPGSGAYVTTQIQGPAVGNDVARQQVTELIDAASTSYTLDVGARLLPWLHAAKVDVAGATLQIADATPAAGDFATVELRYKNAGPDGDSHVWTVLAPHLGDLALPKFDGALAHHNLRADDTISSAQVTWFDTGGALSYAKARANGVELASQMVFRQAAIASRWTQSTPK